MITNEVGHNYDRNSKRKKVYQSVKDYAKKVNKPLMIIGDPYNGISSKFEGDALYGCGDVCIDLTGCPKCKNSIRVKGPIPEKLKQFKNDSYVVYVSYVLEYVDDYEESVKELRRVGGDNVFALTVSPLCLTSYLYPGRKRTMWRNPFPYLHISQ